MTTPYSSHLLSAPTFQAANKMAHRIHSPLFQGFKVSFFLFVQSFLLFLYVDNRLFCTILTWVFWCIGFYFLVCLNGLFLYASSSWYVCLLGEVGLGNGSKSTNMQIKVGIFGKKCGGFVYLWKCVLLSNLMSWVFGDSNWVWQWWEKKERDGGESAERVFGR